MAGFVCLSDYRGDKRQKMTDDALRQLIEKYLSGTITPEEEDRLQDWYERTGDHTDYTDTLSARQKTRLERELWQRITDDNDRLRTIGHRPIKWVRYLRTGVAASLLIGVIALSVYFFRMLPTNTYRTAFGEIRTLTLPDGSEVTLNGNSSITYAGERELWLEGEAYFKVQHTADHQRFRVHLADTLSIEVVGTQFNVHRRPSGTEVALVEGKIILNNGESRIEMKPMDVVYLNDRTNGGFELSSKANVTSHTAWQQRRLLLDHTSLAELTQTLEDTYGISTKVLQDSVLNRKASGSIPVLADQAQFIKQIALLYDLSIVDVTGDRQFVLTGR